MSGKPFSLKAQEADPEIQAGLKPEPQRTATACRSEDDKGYGAPVITGPYWSDGTRAYRVEYFQKHNRYASKDRGSSFYCSSVEDAETLAAHAQGLPTWQGWLSLRDVAVRIAVGRKDGFLFRVMSGEREVFIPQSR